MKKSETILPFNYLHYYAISILIGILAFEVLWLALFYIPFYFLIKTYKYWLSVLVVGVCFFIALLLIKTPNPPSDQTFQITSIKAHDTYYTYEAKQGFYTYVFNHKNAYQIGDYVVIDYTYETFSESKTPNGFNSYHYYASKRIFYQLTVKKITFIKSGFHLNSIKFKLIDLFKDYPPTTRQMIESLVFAHQTFSPEFKENTSLLGVGHLFALSGMHINLIVACLFVIFKQQKRKELIVLSILTAYVLIVGFHISLLRAYLMVLFAYIFKKQGITKLDSLALAFIVILCINPFNRYRLGFILSFLVSFFLIIMPSKRFFLPYLVAYGASVLLISNINGGILLISMLTSLLYTLIFPIVMMPLVFMSLLPGFYYISEPLFLGFQDSYYLFPRLFIKLPYISLIGILIYMALFIYLLLSNDKKMVIKSSAYLLVYMLILMILPHINPQGEVIFLDVNQGDTTLIKRPFNSCHILIDAHYGSSNYIKTLGNISLDYVFITHGDYDHASEFEKIIKTHNVKHIYTNPYDDSEIFNNPFIKRTKRGDTFMCGDVFIEVLSPSKDYKDSNDNSLVLKITVDGQTYLFTGDISETVEDDLIDYYGTKLKSDYLHVAHHGSNTSTSNAFLIYVNPHTAIISVGKNRYNHPHPEVVMRLKDKGIKIIKTIKENSIVIQKYRYRRKYQLLYK